MNELEKIDLIRSRLGVSYAEAKQALDAAGGDVVGALIELEEREKNFSNRIQDRGQEFVGQLKGLLHKTQESRIKIKQGDKTVLEFPAPVGALGLLGVLASSQLAVLGALGTVTAMANNYTLEIDRGDAGGSENREEDVEGGMDPRMGEGPFDYQGPSPGVHDNGLKNRAMAPERDGGTVAGPVRGERGWGSGLHLGAGIWRRGRKRRKAKTVQSMND